MEAFKLNENPFTYLAIAIKCKTAFVDPPRAITITIAFSSDFLVMISRGFKSIFSSSKRCIPAKRHSTNFNGSSAGVEELRRKEMRTKHKNESEYVLRQ